MLWQTAPQTPSAEELDVALIKMCEEHGESEKWPCLTMTTTAFLSIVFRYDVDQVLALPGISSRLVGAKKSRDFDLSSESATADGNRRVYDVVSVLASCDLVLISVTLGGGDERDDLPDKISSRKHVRFNYAVFDDPSTFAVADVSADKLSRRLESERQHDSLASKRRRRSRSLKALTMDVEEVKSSAQRRLSLSSAEHRVSRGRDRCTTKAGGRCQYGADAVAATEDQDVSTLPLRIDIEAIPSFNNDRCDEHSDDGGDHSEQPASRQLMQSVREELDLDSLSPIIKTKHAETRDWWDDSLQDWLFEDALPPQDRLDWELMKAAPQLTGLDQAIWGDNATPPPTQLLVSQTSVGDVDLNCYEDFPSDESPTRFFAFTWNRLGSPTPLEDANGDCSVCA